MNVLLPPEAEAFVADRVESGAYPSADAVILTALRLLKEREERLTDLRREIQKGIDQADQGRVSSFDVTTLEDARRVARERLRATRRGTA